MIEQHVGFEQEATERTEMDSILCSLGYLLLDLLTARYRADDADFFSCVSRVSRLRSQRSGMTGRRRESGDFGRRFLSR